MSVDFNKPELGDTYAGALASLEARAGLVATMFKDAATNIPTDAIKFERTNSKLQSWDGSQWVDKPLGLQGGGTGATDAAGARAALALGALATLNSVGNTQITDVALGKVSGIGALAALNSVSDSEITGVTVGKVSGLGALATLSSVGNAQWAGSPLELAKGGSNATDAAGARATFQAAKLGVNADITKLTVIEVIERAGAVSIGSTNASLVSLKYNGIDRLALNSDTFYPVSTGAVNLGSASNYFNGVRTDRVASSSGRVLSLVGGADGDAAEVHIGSGANIFWISGITGHFVPIDNNARDLGEAGTPRRVRNIYLTNSPNVSSDIRLKEQIKDLESEVALERIKQLKPVSYVWRKDESGEPQVGFIAQQVAHHIPEVVTTGEDKDKTMGMKYERLIPFVVAALQVIERRVASIEGRA